VTRPAVGSIHWPRVISVSTDDNNYRDARLVIIDVLTRMRGRVSDRFDRYQADYHAMAATKTIADDYSVPFLVPITPAKPTPRTSSKPFVAPMVW
jgi:hypothetical protein